MDRGIALHHWLFILIDRSYGDGFQSCLARLADYCNYKAAQCLFDASESVTRGDRGHEAWAECRVETAKRWTAKREAIRKLAGELK